MSASSLNASGLPEVVSNHVDSWHRDQVPDKEHKLTSSHQGLHSEPIEGPVLRSQDVEKGLRYQDIDKLSPEFRQWPDDIVTFDSKDDPQNPKNVCCPTLACYHIVNPSIYF